MKSVKNDTSSYTDNGVIVHDVKLLICDVDGTLTNGTVTYDNNGKSYKTFSVLDGMGFELLRQYQIDIAWISGSNDESITIRANHLGIKNLFLGIKNKVKVIESTLIPTLNITWENIAYIGDDINDLEGIKKARVSAVPADAWIKDHNCHDYTCTRNGGDGAVREFIEKIIKSTIFQTW